MNRGNEQRKGRKEMKGNERKGKDGKGKRKMIYGTGEMKMNREKKRWIMWKDRWGKRTKKREKVKGK